MGRGIRVPKETRICAHSNCDTTFKVRVASTQKYCCVSCITRGSKRSEKFKRNRSENQRKQWQDPEYKRMQHESRLGRVGWNKNLTKETDSRLAGQAEKMTGRIQSKESKEKRSRKLIGRSYIELFGEEKARELIKIRSESMKGENSPFWRGGVTDDPYPEEFVRVRKEIKVRDGYQCQLCEKLEIDEKVEIGNGLSVHHIDYDKQNCAPENLITLCCSCHGKVNADRKYWERFFLDRLQESVICL